MSSEQTKLPNDDLTKRDHEIMVRFARGEDRITLCKEYELKGSEFHLALRYATATVLEELETTKQLLQSCEEFSRGEFSDWTPEQLRNHAKYKVVPTEQLSDAPQYTDAQRNACVDAIQERIAYSPDYPGFLDDADSIVDLVLATLDETREVKA